MSALRDEVGGRAEVVDETLGGALEEGERVAGVTFVGCTFTDSVLDGCAFVGVRALGTQWGSLARPTIPPDPCTWTDCRLDLGAFGGVDLTGSRFERCTFAEADIDGTVLRGAVLDDCDLTGARFVRSDLREVDLTTSRGYAIDPTVNEVIGLRVDPAGALGLLVGFGVEIG